MSLYAKLCACGRTVRVRNLSDPAAAIRRHQQTAAHLTWARKMGYR